MNKPSQITTLSSGYVYQSKWLKVRHDEIMFQNQSLGTYDVVERDDFVLIIPFVNDVFYLVDQYRYPIKARSLEFPQGMIEKIETPQKALSRELSEETGLITSKFHQLGYVYIGNGHHTQAFYVFLTTQCEIGSKKLDPSESDLRTVKLSLTELKNKIKRNEIKDGPTLAAFSLYLINQ